MRRPSILAALLLTAAGAHATPLSGDVDQPQDFFGMQLPDGRHADRFGRFSPEAPPAAGPAWTRFRSAFGGGWHASWDHHSGLPNRIYGSYIDAPDAVKDPEAARRAAESVLFAHLDLLAPGAAPGDFQLASNHLNGNGDYRTVGFVQTHQGLPVQGGQISVRIKNDRVFGLATEALPTAWVEVEVPQTTASGRVMRETAARWVQQTRQTDVEFTGDVEGPFILPIREAGTLRAEVVYRFHLRALDRLEEWDVYVRASDGARVAREQTLLFASGELRLSKPDRYPLNGRVSVGASLLEVRLNGGFGQQDVVSDGTGQLTWPGDAAVEGSPSPVNVFGRTSGVEGTTVEVSNEAGATTFSFTLEPDGVAEVDARNDEFTDAVLNAFAANQVVREYALGIEPNQPWLNQPVVSFVNGDGACNAFSNRLQTFFFRRAQISQSTTCENTALLDDVVYHEFAHSMHGQMLIPGVGSFATDHSEGLSDYLASTMVDDSGMGRGFLTRSSPLRELNPPVPNTWWDLRDDPVQHTRGLTFGGAMWDVREALRGKYPSDGVAQADRLMFATLQRATAITNTFVEALFENDDDGNLGNGTPDFCEIQAAFSVHGLAADSAYGLSVGQPERDGATIRVPVVPSAVTCENAPPSEQTPTVRVRWSVRDGGASGTLMLSPQPEEQAHLGQIPVELVPPGSVVEFQVLVERGDGTEEVRPNTDFDPVYDFLVGDTEMLFCSDFDLRDPFDTEGLSSALLEGNPNNAGANDWQWGEPAGTGAPWDPTEAFSPPNIVGNDLGQSLPDGTQFNGLYQGGVRNRMSLPVVNAAGYDRVFLTYRRWLGVWDRRIDQATVFSNGATVFENVSGAGNDLFNWQDQQWTNEVFDLTRTVSDADDVEVSFEIRTSPRTGGLEGFPGNGGWSLDDVCVLGFRNAVCGDGEVTQREACDDGNQEDGDGCEADCTETPLVCGNGLVQDGEACDDGNRVDDDGCQSDCTETPLVCGNGLVQDSEACDDGNTTDGDGCESDCTLTPVCGNGQVETGEACDDGNTQDGDGCQADCTLGAVCGNGQVEMGEACDDGNTVSGDGCQADCSLPPVPVNPEPDPGESGGGAALQSDRGGCTHSTPATAWPLLVMGVAYGFRRRRV